MSETSRYAAQAVTDESYGDFEIVVQPVGEGPNEWPDGDVAASIPLDGDYTAEADLDHALTGAGFTRVTDWAPTNWGWIATVTRPVYTVTT